MGITPASFRLGRIDNLQRWLISRLANGAGGPGVVCVRVPPEQKMKDDSDYNLCVLFSVIPFPLLNNDVITCIFNWL